MTSRARRAARVVVVPTAYGDARVTFDDPPCAPRAELFLGHGAGGSIDAPELEAVARALPALGIRVGRVEQPYRVAGKALSSDKAQLDGAFREVVVATRDVRAPLYVGGRSAGARVAARTAGSLGAVGVVALAFPLEPPRRSRAGGKPAPSRAPELLGVTCPALVVQGTRDPFGGPSDIAGVEPAPTTEIFTVEGGDHSFVTPRGGAPSAEVMGAIAGAIAAFLDRTLSLGRDRARGKRASTTLEQGSELVGAGKGASLLATKGSPTKRSPARPKRVRERD